MSFSWAFAETNEPVITSFTPNGRLEWSDAQTTGLYRIEWRPSLDKPWKGSFDDLKNIPPSPNGAYAADVHIFYRVVRIDHLQDAPAGSKVVTIDTEHLKRNIETAWNVPPSLWATMDGTVYSCAIRMPQYIAVGHTVTCSAEVTPALPGTYEWFITSDKIKLGNTTSKVTTIQGLAHSDRMGDISIFLRWTPLVPRPEGDGKPVH